MTTADVRREGHNALEKAARAGYVARGAVFLIIGYFAFRSAFAGGRTLGSEDAIDTVFGSAFGTILLWLLVVSLAGFAVWRLIQVFYDVDRHGTGAKGLTVRAGLLGSAVAYGALAAYAGALAIGTGAQSSGGGSQGIIARIYDAGFGVWLTYLVAAVVAAVGAAHVYKGATAGFEKYMVIPAAIRGWLKPVCQFGLIARGVSFFIIAFLLVTGAATYSDGDTPGLESALDAISSWAFGSILLSLMGLGLIAFGVYALAEARYRRIHVERV